jgi:hypothetical protein
MKNLTKIKMIISLIIINIVVLLLINNYSDNFIYKNIMTKAISSINYSTNQTYKEIKTNDISKYKDILIKFKMKAYPANYYSNIFQVSKDNTGIRMELINNSMLSIYINAKNYEGYRHFELKNTIESDKWYSVVFNIDKNNHIEVFLNNEKVISIYDSSLRYLISDIAIGTGINNNRPFYGEIKDFSVSYKFFDKNIVLFGIILTVQVLFILFTFILSLYLIKIFLNRTDKAKIEQFNPFIGKRISIITSILLIGFILAVIFHYALASYFNLNSYPYNTFIFWQVDAFNDFYRLVYDLCGNLNPYFELNGLYSQYFPLSFLVSYPFSLIPTKQASYILFSLLFIICFILFNYINIKAANKEGSLVDVVKNLFIFSFLSYPFLFCLDRGNLEWVVFVLLAAFVYFFSQKNYKISSIFLAIAIALKIYPVLFITMFVAKKRYKDLRLILLIVSILVIIPFLMLKGGIFHNILGLLINLGTYKKFFIVDTVGLSYGTTIFGAIKIIMLKIGPYITYSQLFTFANLYSIYSFISTLILLGYVLFLEKTYWKQITILFITTLALPHVSADYRLMLLFIPMWLFIRSNTKSKYDTLYCILFGLLLIPKNYIYLAPIQNIYASISIVLNPLLMTIMVILIGIENFISRKDLKIQEQVQSNN